MSLTPLKGYRSDFDVLVLVNESRFAGFEYWDRATDRLNRDAAIGVPVGLIVHSGREVNNALRNAQYFFSDIRKEGVLLYEMDDRELAEPGILSPQQALEIGREQYNQRFQIAFNFLKGARFIRLNTMIKKPHFCFTSRLNKLMQQCCWC